MKRCFIKIAIVLGIATLVLGCASLGTQDKSAAPPPGKSGTNYFAYVGTNGAPKSKGIYAYRFSAATGQLDSIGLVAELDKPSWVVEHPSHKYIYATNDMGNNKVGEIYSYKIDAKTGKLRFLNWVSSVGGGPTHLAVDKTGKVLLSANYGAGQVVAFQLNADGSIGKQTALMQHTGKGPHPQRQTSPHAHGVFVSNDNRHLITPDLGVDKVFIYRLDANQGTLVPEDIPFVAMPPRTGPRHFAFHPNGRFAYLISEFNSSVTAFAYTSATGALKPLQTISTLTADFKGGPKGAELFVDQTGRFLYANSKSDDMIAVYSIDPQAGTLTLIQRIASQGKYTYHLVADPAGQYLFVANRESGNAAILKIDSATGKLIPTGKEMKVPQAICTMFVPADSR